MLLWCVDSSQITSSACINNFITSKIFKGLGNFLYKPLNGVFIALVLAAFQEIADPNVRIESFLMSIHQHMFVIRIQ